MKILQLLPTLDPSSGGVARTVLATSRALAARGHTTEIASLDGPNAAWVADAGLFVHGLGDSLTTYSYSKKLLPWLRENAARFDRVIGNGVWQNHSLAAWGAFPWLGGFLKCCLIVPVSTGPVRGKLTAHPR